MQKKRKKSLPILYMSCTFYIISILVAIFTVMIERPLFILVSIILYIIGLVFTSIFGVLYS